MNRRLYRKRTTEVYTQSTLVKADCQTIVFYNAGSSPFRVLNIEVLPNTQQMFSGQFCEEIDVTEYELIFLNNFAIANNKCIVIREFIDEKEN